MVLTHKREIYTYRNSAFANEVIVHEDTRKTIQKNIVRRVLDVTLGSTSLVRYLFGENIRSILTLKKAVACSLGMLTHSNLALISTTAITTLCVFSSPLDPFPLGIVLFPSIANVVLVALSCATAILIDIVAMGADWNKKGPPFFFTEPPSAADLLFIRGGLGGPIRQG